jgi:hypothetical protein
MVKRGQKSTLPLNEGLGCDRVGVCLVYVEIGILKRAGFLRCDATGRWGYFGCERDEETGEAAGAAESLLLRWRFVWAVVPDAGDVGLYCVLVYSHAQYCPSIFTLKCKHTTMQCPEPIINS